MRTNLKWLGLGGVLGASMLMAMNSQAVDAFQTNDLFDACMVRVREDCQSWAKKGGGGEAPRGLSGDTYAELSLGERYILSGYVTIASGEVFLRIDFKSHPWLASRVRKRNPFYRIDDAPSRWKKYRDHDVTIIATAEYDAWEERDGTRKVEIFLIPDADPVLPELQRSDR